METTEVDNIEITDENFHQYFLDARRYKPQKGQVTAIFRGVAALVAGPEKMDLIKLLKIDKAQQATMVMKKIHCAKDPYCYSVCREICEDMLNGMSDEEILAKEYKFVVEAYYYVDPKYVPRNNKHWSTLDFIKFDKDEKTFKLSIDI